MADNGRFDNISMIELTGKLAVVAIICLSCVSMFVFCLHLYSKWFWDRNTTTTTTTIRRRRRRRLDFAAGNQETTAALHRGLDPLLLKALPVIAFNPKEFKDELECAVCLCEVSEGEKARVLPKCNHGFHLDCIDMWFQSHSTCPLCRNSVGVHNRSNHESETTLEAILDAPIGENSIEALNFSNETQVRSFGPCDVGGVSSSSSSLVVSTSDRRDGTLVIDIPREINEEEEQKAQVPTRLESFKRLLSGNRRVNPSSPRNLDIEQGDYPQS